MNSINYFDNANKTKSTIMDIKGRLLIDDATSKMSAIKWIEDILRRASDESRECFIEELISSDVALHLCKILGSSVGEIFTSILVILDDLRHSRNFYDHDLGKMAVQSIFRIVHFMLKKPECHQTELNSVTYTLYVILNGATAMDYPIPRIRDPKDVLRFLKLLKASKSAKYLLRLFAGKLLCLVAQWIDLRYDEETHGDLFFVFDDLLLAIQMIIDEKYDDGHTSRRALRVVCSICAVGTRFCHDDDAEVTPTAAQFGGAAFAELISKVMVETVLPLFKSITFEQEEADVYVKDIVECLEHLMMLKCCDTDEIANSLVANGYLKYLLTIPFPIRDRDSMCSLVSEVIAHLSTDSLPTADSPQNRVEFRNYLYDGFESVERPLYSNNFESILDCDDISSDVLAITMYHHVRGTADHSMFSLPMLIRKLLRGVTTEPIIVLKAVWLMFAVSWVEHAEPQSIGDSKAAEQRLAVLLENNDLEKLYTYHRAIVEHSIVCEGFPMELKRKIIRLWVEFDGDTGTLLLSAKYDFIADCFVNFVETGPAKFVTKALGYVEELKKENRFQERIDVLVWQALSRALSSCIITENLAGAKGLLKLSAESKLETRDDIEEIDGQSIVRLLNMLMLQPVDEEFETLLVKYLRTLLEVSSARNNTKVAHTCLDNLELARSLRDAAFIKHNDQLAAASLDLLVSIVEAQTKFRLECNAQAIVKLEPLKILVLLARTSRDLSRAAMRLLLALVNPEIAIVEPIVSSCEFEDDAAAEKAIFAWYRQLLLLHSRASPKDWNLVCRCLTAVLRYCDFKKFANLLRGLCDYSGLYPLIDWTIECKHSDATFFELVRTWSYYLKAYRARSWTMTMVDEPEENSLGPTQLKKTMAKLRQFKQECDKKELECQ